MSAYIRPAITGRLTAAPELRYTPSGRAVANARVAWSPSVRGDDGTWTDGEAVYVDVRLWGRTGEAAAELPKGAAVVVILGPQAPEARAWTSRDGEARAGLIYTGDVIAPIAWAPRAETADQAATAGDVR